MNKKPIKKEVFVVIADVRERAELFAKALRNSNVAVKQAHSKADLDNIDSEDEIIAFIVHPVIEEDIPRITKLYQKPIFVIGDLDPNKLDSLLDHGVLGIYREVYMPEIFKKLGREWEFSRPKSSAVIKERSTVSQRQTKKGIPSFENDDSDVDVDVEEDKTKRKRKFRSSKSKKESIPTLEDEEETPPKKKKNYFPVFSKLIKKNK